MTTQNPVGESCPKSTITELHIEVIDSFDGRLSRSFELIMRNVEPYELIRPDFDTVLIDIQHLANALKALKAAVLGGVA